MNNGEIATRLWYLSQFVSTREEELLSIRLRFAFRLSPLA